MVSGIQIDGKEVKRFAQRETIYKDGRSLKNQDYEYHVVFVDGSKLYVSSGTISSLWSHWTTSKNISKYTENGFVIFEYRGESLN